MKDEPDWRTENIVKEIRGQTHCPVVVLSKAQAEEAADIIEAALRDGVIWTPDEDTGDEEEQILAMLIKDVGVRNSIGILHQAKKVKEGRIQ